MTATWGGDAVLDDRTAYAIKLVRIDVWAGDHNRWVADAAHAKRFEFMTMAVHYAAMDLELAPDEYTVEPVTGRGATQ